MRINKIVCFGLGHIRRKNRGKEEPNFQEVLQHLAAFSIAEAVNSTQDSDAKKVGVVCQDPCYTTLDQILLKEEFSRTCHVPIESVQDSLHFVSDPEGFLAIDEHTLVITAFMPTTVPLMQICADLPRPAAFICDKMNLDHAKKVYDGVERSTPRVRNMLKEYARGDFNDHVVEKQMFELCCGVAPYWLWKMDGFMRLKKAGEVAENTN
ncbi:hypothetical protein P280DRAFT_388030 [Massarina eburnea CBS 473.64]|uniref:SRR1-like domain-containing protein n=1 Tax=Massarina eburnea CBS 473.64 TaxID=1395130 RepID=A0A6A6SJE5_9PLEO|nr:hypothetical protein P280DRAFT_388030 [Massarina eburnea CBS 473.64]